MDEAADKPNLRALFYMDEIFGYFPPTATPPSKLAMLTLLKQARAFGLGIILSTQNPVDLDYKGLANCGTWFIGKLQTARDKARVVEGLSAASNGELTGAKIDQWMATSGNRVFILRSIHLPDPLLFQTRWTLSYLRGPLTLPQIAILMEPQKKENPASISSPPPAKQKTELPSAPAGIQEYYLLRTEKDPFRPSPNFWQGKTSFYRCQKKNRFMANYFYGCRSAGRNSPA